MKTLKMKTICHIFGHKWITSGIVRTCKRCGIVEVYTRYIIEKIGNRMFRKIKL